MHVEMSPHEIILAEITHMEISHSRFDTKHRHAQSQIHQHSDV